MLARFYYSQDKLTVASIPKMGIYIPDMGILGSDSAVGTPSGLADALFTSVQQRVLGLLFGNPARRYQGAELIRLAQAGSGATHRVLTRLAASGLVRVETQGRQKYYQANPESPIFEDLVSLVRKTVGLVDPLRQALGPLRPQITAAFVYGSVAQGRDHADSDVDLMVIARDVDYPALYDALQPAEEALARPINPNLISPEQWQRKCMEPGSFAARVMERPRLFVMGADDDLR